MSIWRLVHTSPSRGAWNMAVDESILEHIHRGQSQPTLRLYAWEPACLSLGHAQPFADVDMQRVTANGWEVVRRLTGGRAILHTDELTYSVTGSADEPSLAGGVLESYNRLAQAMLAAVRELGLVAELKDAAGPASGAANPICFEVPSTYEITVNGKKLIGSAQARKKEGVLQHGSLPLTGDLTRICQALMFNDDPARARAAQRLLERAATVEESLGAKIDWDTAARGFARGFEAQLGIRFERGELSRSEAERAEELALEKYANPLWTERI
jgi:lipoyl(octanoyl) transferase